MPNDESESSGGSESNVANIGVDGGTNGLLFNDEDNDDGSCLTRFVLITAIAGELFIVFVGCVNVDDEEFIDTPCDKHLRSNSYMNKII